MHPNVTFQTAALGKRSEVSVTFSGNRPACGFDPSLPSLSLLRIHAGAISVDGLAGIRIPLGLLRRQPLGRGCGSPVGRLDGGVFPGESPPFTINIPKAKNGSLGELMGAFLFVFQSVKKECCCSLNRGLTRRLNRGWRGRKGGCSSGGHDLSHRCKSLMMQWECCLPVLKTPLAV